MKKNHTEVAWSSHAITKMFLFMRIALFLLMVGIIQSFALESKSQSARISIAVKEMKLEDILEKIESISKYRFAYNKTEINVDKTYSVNVNNVEIEEVLNRLFQKENIHYAIVDRQIVLLPSVGLLGNSQQQKSVSGKVTDTIGESLPGVSVVVKGTTNGTITDANGFYSLSNIPANATLQFSFVGMKRQEIVVGTKTSIDVSLEEETVGIEEVVAIGYGAQKKASLTAAISNMKTEQIVRIPTSNLSNVLAGRLSGAFVQSGTGTPGISSNIKIRGTASWNGGSPVYVIDGVVRDKTSFDVLDPNEVAEITILKDAASAAIYGSRSANGVVLVNTKKGASGKIKVEYSSVFATQKVGKLPEYMDMSDGLKLSNSIYGGYSDEEIAWVLKTNPGGMNNYNAAYQDPISQKHSVSVSGGSEKVTYYIGGSFFDEKGFLPNVWYKKYNLRANVSAKVTKDMTVGLNVSNSYGTRNRFNFTYDAGSEDLNNLWGKLLYWDVFIPPYIDGKPVNPGWLGNIVEMMRNGGYWRNNNQQIDALINVEYQVPFVKGLSAKVSYSRNMDNSYIKNYAKKQTLYNFKTTGANSHIFTNEVLSQVQSGDPGSEYIGNEYKKTDAYQLNGQINYDGRFGDHHIIATAVYEQYEFQGNDFSMYRFNFPLFPKDQFFAASKNNSDWSTDGSEWQDGRLSYIGRANYDYANKYFFSSSIRRDGSVKFSPSRRWGWFPSVSGGWLISNEKFYQDSKLSNAIEMLKLRVSFGSTGNDITGGWGWLDQYQINSGSYYMGNPGTAAPRLSYSGIPNADLTWEKSNSVNLGLDLKLLRHISFTAELWNRKTYDILAPRVLVLPSEFGGSLPQTNYGKVNTRGLEFDLGYDNKIGADFKYNVKVNFGLATSEVKLKDYATNAQFVDNPVGKTMNYGIGYQTTGILRTQADLDKLPSGYTIFSAKPELGMMNFEDRSGPAGKSDGKIDSYDRVVIGNYMGSNSAPVSYGLMVNLSYKGFTLDAMFAGLAGFNLTYSDAWGRNFGGGGKVPAYHANSWTTENPNGTTPKLFPWGDSRSKGYTVASDLNTYKGDFLRLKNVNLGYNIPASLLKITGISNAQVFVSGTNLFCWSKFKFYDPEITQFMSYPIMKTYSLGLNIQF